MWKYHGDSINDLLYSAHNNIMISCSDDKTLRCLDGRMPKQYKCVAASHMNVIMNLSRVSEGSMKTIFLAHSMDNQILTYSCTGQTLRLEDSKSFSGHIVVGYRIAAHCSPDAKYISSGDSTGNFWLWEAKSHRVVRKFMAHGGCVLCTHLWHPSLPYLVTGAWDGGIKIWY